MTRTVRRRVTRTSSTVDGRRWGYGRSPPGWWGRWGDLDLSTCWIDASWGYPMLKAWTFERETGHRIRPRCFPGMRLDGGAVESVAAECVDGVWWWVYNVRRDA